MHPGNVLVLPNYQANVLVAVAADIKDAIHCGAKLKHKHNSSSSVRVVLQVVGESISRWAPTVFFSSVTVFLK